MKARTGIAILGLALLLCAGCGGGSAARRPALQPSITPNQEYRHETSARDNPGSLFAASEEDPLFSDSRARRVGDIVVVKLVENTKAQNKAETTANKDSSTDYSVASLFTQSRAGFLPFLPLGPRGNVSGTDSLMKTGSGDDLSATGKTKRENYVTSSMAARVIRVLPGGLLQIEGKREIRVNEETEYMVVRGTIRSRDVDADNTILSNQIADASIEYSGRGVLADKQKPGWFTRLMDNVWPF